MHDLGHLLDIEPSGRTPPPGSIGFESSNAFAPAQTAVPEIHRTPVPIRQRFAVAGVILVVVGAADRPDRATLESPQHLVTDVAKPGVHQEVTDEIGRDLKTQPPGPPAGDP